LFKTTDRNHKKNGKVLRRSFLIVSHKCLIVVNSSSQTIRTVDGENDDDNNNNNNKNNRRFEVEQPDSGGLPATTRRKTELWTWFGTNVQRYSWQCRLPVSTRSDTNLPYPIDPVLRSTLLYSIIIIIIIIITTRILNLLLDRSTKEINTGRRFSVAFHEV